MAHFSYYSAGRVLSEALFLIRGFLVAGILGPGLYGIWTKMKIVLLLLHHAQLGVHEAMLREVPFAVGRRRFGEVEAIERNVFGLCLIVAATVAAGIVGVVALRSGSWTGFAANGWSLVAAVFLAGQFYWYLHFRLRAEKRFTNVSRIMIAFAGASTLFGVVAADHSGLSGFLVALCLSYVLAISCTGIRGFPFPRPEWNGVVLRRLVRVGFPIMASGGLGILFWNVDKIAIWCLLPHESLGVYALPSYLVISTTMFPEAVATVLYPRLMERLGGPAPEGTVERFLVRPTLLIGYLSCPLLGMLYVGLHLPLRWLLPEYEEGIVPGQILIASLFFMAIPRIAQIVLVSQNRQKLLLALTAVAVAAGGVAVVSLLLRGEGLVGAASGTAAAYLLYSVLILSAALCCSGMSAARVRSFLMRLLWPYVVTAATVAAVVMLLPAGAGSFETDLVRTGARCLCIGAVGTGLLWQAHRRHGLLVPPKPEG